jgi:hypothetical protein
MAFIVTPYMTEAEREHGRREVEFDELLKRMEEWSAILIVNLKVLRRNGPSTDLLRRIDEAGTEFTSRLKLVMDSAKSGHYRLEGPRQR